MPFASFVMGLDVGKPWNTLFSCRVADCRSSFARIFANPGCGLVWFCSGRLLFGTGEGVGFEAAERPVMTLAVQVLLAAEACSRSLVWHNAAAD